MGNLIQPLRDEHASLRPDLERIVLAADAIEPGRDPAQAERVGAVLTFIEDRLLDHAYVEEQALYPVVSRTLGAPQAADTMRRDHVEIARLTNELKALHGTLTEGALAADQARALRRLLYSLYAIISLHLAKEEELYLPLLDERLSPHQAEELMEALKLAAEPA